MNVFLMHRDKDFDEKAELPWSEQALREDLGLDTLIQAMSCGDALIDAVARRALLCSLTEVQTIRYRQGILADCIEHPQVVRKLYALTEAAIERRRKHYLGVFARSYPSSILHGSVELLHEYIGMLRELRIIAENHDATFRSQGFTSLFAMLRRELSEEYLAIVFQQLRELQLRKGAMVSARLGEGNKGTGYVLRRPTKIRGWLKRVLAREPATFAFRIADRDEGGARALGEMRDQAVNPVANVLAQSADHVVGFFTMLRTELAFYVGCLNLHEEFAQRGLPICMPDPAAAPERMHAFRGLYDASLALVMEGTVVGSDVEANGKQLAFITGANQGGKSTFLRSIGIAQLMMQCGLFVAARSFQANVCRGVFTHYGREEDPGMKSGKFDEELGRMSEIVDHIEENSLVLFNESFSATNEREGSEIARQIVTALLDKAVKVFFVTHMYELARGFYDRNGYRGIFLRAGRRQDGTRTFEMEEGVPLETSYGRDLYQRIFATADRAQARSA
jgi:hypothetical protein